MLMLFKRKIFKILLNLGVLRCYKMEFSEKHKDRACLDIKNSKGKPIGCVCVVSSKDYRKKDIIIMPRDKPAKSVRSTTELINKLHNFDVSYEERKKAMDFTSFRLKTLDDFKERES